MEEADLKFNINDDAPLKQSQILDKATLLLNRLQEKIQLDNDNCNLMRNSSDNTLNNSDDTLKDNINEITKDENIKQWLDDIAIIQAFYGNDIKRIQATVRALEKYVNDSVKPQDFIFVEAQQSSDNFVFQWVKKYGIKYFKIKIPKDSKGIFLKTALWNIGATKTSAAKLCFIDSDVVFEGSSWLNDVYSAFEKYDVLSLAGHCQYENDDRYKTQIESIGYTIMMSNETKFSGHIGFNIGMTRSAYELYGRFEAFILHSDMWMWQKICGSQNYKDISGFTPYSTDSIKDGLPLKVGSTELVCTHLNHGKMHRQKYKAYSYFTYDHLSKPFAEFIYDPIANVNVLPKWNTTKEAVVIKNCVQKFEQYNQLFNDDMDKIADFYSNEANDVYGIIDSEHPLIIATVFKHDFKHKDASYVVQHKQMTEKYCKDQFTYVCFSNDKILGIDTIPYDEANISTLDANTVNNIIFNKKIKYPKNATVKYIDIDQIIHKPFNVLRDPIDDSSKKQ